jgi:hypothetical protein
MINPTQLDDDEPFIEEGGAYNLEAYGAGPMSHPDEGLVNY